jgi:ABC-type antimicrobial peptide transport system permease subunit
VTYRCFKALTWLKRSSVIGPKHPRCDSPRESFSVARPDVVGVQNIQVIVIYDPRTVDSPAAPAPAVKSVIRSVDRSQPIVRVITMDRLMAVAESERRLVLILFEAFGVVALILAAVGIYGVLSGNVAERTRGIGVRAALGASRGQILALILGDGMRLTAFSIVIGLCGAFAAAQGIMWRWQKQEMYAHDRNVSLRIP